MINIHVTVVSHAGVTLQNFFQEFSELPAKDAIVTLPDGPHKVISVMRDSREEKASITVYQE